MDAVGDIIDGVKREAEPQNGGGGGGGGGGGDDDGPIPSHISAPQRTKGLGTEIAKATDEVTMPGDGITDATATEALSAPTESSSSDSDGGSDGGSNAGVIAGIVFGVLGGLLLLGLGIYFLVSKRSKGSRQNGEEKFTPMNKASPPPPPMKDSNVNNSKSPRLSLRPVTQFFPNFAAGGDNNKRNSKGLGFPMAAAGAAGAGRRSPGPNPFERPSTSQSSHPANPFGNQAERPHTPIAEEHSMYSRTQPPTPDRNNKPLPAAGRQQSMHGPDRTTQWELTLPDTRGPPSPAGTEFSMSSMAAGSGPTPPSNGAAAIAAAGGPKNTAVHRVQLDFKPTLEDEMELKAGELVRLLHEYDDGWVSFTSNFEIFRLILTIHKALCIRLDRSRQGVVPRTCLSTRPVKPRAPNGGSRGGPLPINPQGAPRPQGPGQRPMTPSGRPESPGPVRPGTATGPRSQSPAGFRAQSPAGLRSQSPMGRQPRPMSPAGAPPMSPGPSGRSQSPGPRQQPAGRPRAPSKSHGPSPMNPAAQRQTLWPAPPGQAM